MAIVAGRVVHEHADPVQIGGRGRAHPPQRRDVDQVDLVEAGPVADAGRGTGVHDGASLLRLDVGEADAAALPGELLDQGAADAVGAAGDEDAAIDEGRVRREDAG